MKILFSICLAFIWCIAPVRSFASEEYSEQQAIHSLTCRASAASN